MTARWEFWIDVGGTFTDCIVRSPDDRLRTIKVLSSGLTKGRMAATAGTSGFVDPLRQREPEDFWRGCTIRLLNADGSVNWTGLVRSSSPSGELQLAPHNAGEPQPALTASTGYELDSGMEAPILAIRTALGLRLDEAIPPVIMRLGTTRGTNALLTRRGARTAFLTTKGFRDILLIANQDRPRLFDLAIRKPEPLFERAVEVDERLDCHGNELRPVDEASLRRELKALRADGIESLAICLLHAFTKGDHEETVARLAHEAGFREVSVSSRLAPLIRIVSRGDTTVMDAYLNPILRAYVERLRSRLPGSDIRLMTSSGGLTDAGSFTGKDSILSGPAGGVIGFARVAQKAGFAKAIGFDMGGTSTDVSRFDGRFEYEFETQKAGVRIVAPMLAIETVAAGGGSICGFDGVKLFVGPQSAGADPGPACYGRGGPLSVTDINVYLGRVLPEWFPFPLDVRAVESRLADLCRQVAESPLGRRYTPVELAEGFRQIANTIMARAIRRISVAKGYDPADYVLVSFGGAGAQHACALARSLGMRQVLVHPWSGLLSAYGIGLADVRRFAERSVLKPFNDESLTAVDAVFEDLLTQVRAEVQAEGIPLERIAPPVRSLDLRYQGIEATINVIWTGSHSSSAGAQEFDWRAAYETQHEQLYGYRRRGRPLEIVAARLELVGQTADPPDDLQPVIERTIEGSTFRPAWFDGVECSTAVFQRSELRSGDRFPGPAIVCEDGSTVVVDPGFEARIGPRGEIIMTSLEDPPPSASGTASAREQADPVLLEVFNNQFASIAEQMGVTLQKTALSTNVKERLDFSCAIFTPAGDLVVNAPHIPVHLGAMSETVKRLLADVPDLQPGEVYVTNDPFRGGSHLPDVTVITPVHDQATGRLIFLTASRAHHAEIGGIVPGSMPPFSKNLAEEGVVIRCFRLISREADGSLRSHEDDLRALLQSGPYPSRSVSDNLADIDAQVAACRAGARQLLQLVTEQSLETVEAFMRHIQTAAAEKMRRALTALPDGVYERTDHLDDGSPIAVTITVRGSQATVDFTGTGPVLKSNLNANRAIVSAAVLYVFRCLIQEDIPLNSGVLEPVTIILPECLLNPPAHEDPAECVAIVGGNVETSQRVVDVLLGALRLAAASQGTMNNLTFGDGSFGYYETICGGSGATPDADGADAVHTHMTNTRLTDPEVIERRYPVRLHEFSIRRGSGGRGRHRGGDGIIRRIEFLTPLSVSLLTERRGPYPPFGMEGGEPGQCGRNAVLKADSGQIEYLPGKIQFQTRPGDILTIETPGAGGWGAHS